MLRKTVWQTEAMFEQQHCLHGDRNNIKTQVPAITFLELEIYTRLSPDLVHGNKEKIWTKITKVGVDSRLQLRIIAGSRTSNGTRSRRDTITIDTFFITDRGWPNLHGSWGILVNRGSGSQHKAQWHNSATAKHNGDLSDFNQNTVNA